MEIILVVFLLILLMFFTCQQNISGFSTRVIKDLTKFNGRQPGTLDHYQSYLYLLNKVQLLNVKEVPWAPGFTQKFKYRGISHQNIIFTIRGGFDNPKIIIFAHYDHIGPGFPGGNDNGSGVFALLQIAERISMLPPTSIILPVLFVLSDGEENGMMGSKIISDLLPSNNVIINLDTIGGFPDNNIVRVANNGNYSDYFMQKAKKNRMDLMLIDILPGRSDITHFLEYNTCIEFGYPTSASHYHSYDDTYENLSKNNMFKIIEIAGDLTEDLCLGKLPIIPTII